jgi:hypothetical protein
MKVDIENPFIIPSASESRLVGVFDEDMVFPNVKFFGLCKHSFNGLYVFLK